MSLFDDFSLGGVTDFLRSATKSVADVAGSIADAKFGWESRSLDLATKQAQIDATRNQIKIGNTISDAQVQLAKLQAQNALKQAQDGFNGIESLNADNIGQAIANLNARITGQSSGPNWALYIGIAGLVIAYLQLRQHS